MESILGVREEGYGLCKERSSEGRGSNHDDAEFRLSSGGVGECGGGWMTFTELMLGFCTREKKKIRSALSRPLPRFTVRLEAQGLEPVPRRLALALRED